MNWRKLAMLPTAVALISFGPDSRAELWDWSFTDMGVNYSLSFDSLAGNVGTFTLNVDTTGYNQQPGPAYLDSVDIKAWGGTNISFSLLSAPIGSAWLSTQGPISSGPAGSTGCGGTGSGFACVEAATKGVFNVLNGPYSFQFVVTADNFYTTSPTGSHVGAGYADATGAGSSYGITSVVAPIPEPSEYAMLLAGLGVLMFVARRRRAVLAIA